SPPSCRPSSSWPSPSAALSRRADAQTLSAPRTRGRRPGRKRPLHKWQGCDPLAPMDFLGRATTFVRIVEVGSLSSAARSLGVSLAAVSRQASSLAEELGAPLLLRATRPVKLTPPG